MRDIVAEIESSALHYFVAGFEGRSDEEYQRLKLLEYKVQLMLNPREDDHQRLALNIRKIIEGLSRGKEGDEAFQTSHVEVKNLASQILKREWDRMKEAIAVEPVTPG